MDFFRKNEARVCAFGTVLLWSSAFVLTRVALTHFTAPALGLLRYLTASLCFLVIAPIRKIGLPRLRDVPLFLVSGLLGFGLYMVVFNRASQSLTSATGSVIIATAPIITALLALVILRERIKAAGWAAIAVSFAGILVLTLWNGVLSVTEGIPWMFAAALCISGYNLCQRHFRGRYTPLQSTAYSIFAGTLFLLFSLPEAAEQLASAPPVQWAVIVYLGVFPSAIAYLLWGRALAVAGKTSDVTNFMFVTPFLSALLGFLVRGEGLDAPTLLGGLIILGGLVLFQRISTRAGKTKVEAKEIPEK